jgi:hypothetical protein
MTNASRLHLALPMIIIAVASLVTACNVYTDQETEARQRFEAATIGTREDELIATLGMPQGYVTRSGPNQLSFEFGELSNRGRILVDEADRSRWPQELQFLPKRAVSNRVLIYLDGTVWAFYYLGSDRQVEHVSVHIS